MPGGAFAFLPGCYKIVALAFSAYPFQGFEVQPC